MNGTVQTFTENGAISLMKKLDKNGKKKGEWHFFHENGPLNKIGSSRFGLEGAVQKSCNAIGTLDSCNYLDCYPP